jgi:hypothetical protein
MQSGLDNFIYLVMVLLNEKRVIYFVISFIFLPSVRETAR